MVELEVELRVMVGVVDAKTEEVVVNDELELEVDAKASVCGGTANCVEVEQVFCNLTRSSPSLETNGVKRIRHVSTTTLPSGLVSQQAIMSYS